MLESTSERWRGLRRRAFLLARIHPASKVYEEVDVLMIAPSSVNSSLTDEGGQNVFRVCDRDDRQGAKVADYLARDWADKAIAILDDRTVWGADVATRSGAGCRSAV